MKASELRLNNWVRFSEEQIDFKVIEISEKGIAVVNVSEETWIELDQFEPIKLTEDWLVKFGFVQYDKISYELRISSEYVVKLDITLPSCETFIIEGDADDIEDKNFVCIPIKCKYVHQLQNLYFALTGEELTLNSNP